MNYRTSYEFEIIQHQQTALRSEVATIKLAKTIRKTHKFHFILSFKRSLGNSLILVGEHLVMTNERPGASF